MTTTLKGAVKLLGKSSITVANAITAAALVQDRTNYPASSQFTPTLAYTTPVGVGHFLLAIISWHNNTPDDSGTVTCADTQSNTWVTIPKHFFNTPDDGTIIAAFCCFSSNAGATTVTITGHSPGGMTDIGMRIYEYSGTDTSAVALHAGPVNTDATTGVFTSTPISGTITTSVPCLLILIEADENRTQSPEGYADGHVSGGSGAVTNVRTNEPTHTDCLVDCLAVPAGSYTPSLNFLHQSSDEWTMQAIAVKLA